MTLLLAMDTATPRVAVAIGEDARVLGSVYLDARRRQRLGAGVGTRSPHRIGVPARRSR